MQATWKPIDKLSLSTTLVFVGTFVDGNRDFSIPRLNAPGYTLVNLAANYEVTENFSAFAGLIISSMSAIRIRPDSWPPASAYSAA
jgi:vitamin B12 transporter